jgi:hypothetical protein
MRRNGRKRRGLAASDLPVGRDTCAFGWPGVWSDLSAPNNTWMDTQSVCPGWCLRDWSRRLTASALRELTHPVHLL